MKTGTAVFIGFVFGTAAGAAGMYVLMEDKIIEWANSEVESVKEAYENKLNQLVAEHEESVSEVPDEYMKPEYIKEKKKFDEAMAEKNFTDYTAFGPEIKQETEEKTEEVKEEREEEVSEDPPPDVKPYVISSNGLTGFGMMGYEQIVYTWYDDGVLADDDDEMIFDDSYIERTIGLDNFNTFVSNNNMDVMYVRNDRLETDYEVVKSLSKYADRIEHSPRKMSDV